MQIPTVLMLCLTIVTGLVAIIFLFFPDSIKQLEARINAPWGDRELASLRFGLRGERVFEEAINRNVLAKQIVWDGWFRRHPRLVGTALCLFAVWLGWQV